MADLPEGYTLLDTIKTGSPWVSRKTFGLIAGNRLMNREAYHFSNFMVGVTAWAKVDTICNVPIVKNTILIPDMNKDINAL